jgi:hypothetical protein
MKSATTLVLGGTGRTGRRVAEPCRRRPARTFADYVQRTAATGIWGDQHVSA